MILGCYQLPVYISVYSFCHCMLISINLFIYIIPSPTFQISCGHEFTNKLHRMYTDIKISHDLREKFSEFVDKQISDGEPGLGINFNILVLQDGAWPIGQSKQPSFNLPQELERSIQLVSYLR